MVEHECLLSGISKNTSTCCTSLPLFVLFCFLGVRFVSSLSGGLDWWFGDLNPFRASNRRRRGSHASTSSPTAGSARERANLRRPMLREISATQRFEEIGYVQNHEAPMASRRLRRSRVSGSRAMDSASPGVRASVGRSFDSVSSPSFLVRHHLFSRVWPILLKRRMPEDNGDETARLWLTCNTKPNRALPK